MQLICFTDHKIFPGIHPFIFHRDFSCNTIHGGEQLCHFLFACSFVCEFVISSPELEVLMMSYCGQWLSVVVRRVSSVVRRPSTFDVYTLVVYEGKPQERPRTLNNLLLCCFRLQIFRKVNAQVRLLGC